MTLDSERVSRWTAHDRRWALGLSLAVAVLASAPRAAAQEADAETRTAARELAGQGAEAFEKQDYVTALDRFQRAGTLFRAPSISVMEARTLVKLGRFVEALDKYEATRHIPLAPDASEALQRAVSDAVREGQELRARTPMLKISILGRRPGPDELKVTLDGKPVPSALLDVERPLDPGRHEIEAASAGLIPIQRRIDLSEGEHRVVEIQLGAASPDERLLLKAQSQRTDNVPMVAEASPAASNELVPWGWAATGLGIVSLGTSAVTGVIALNKKSNLDAACRPGCPPEFQGDIDSYRLNRTLSYTGLLVGAAALGVGGYILIYGSRESSHVRAAVTTQGAALSGAF